MPISFEFFPPKNDIGSTHFALALRNASEWQPQFVSITCGAGGSAIHGTFSTVKYIRDHFPLTVIPHIAYARLPKKILYDLLHRYQQLGVKQIVALRGDPATGKNEAPLLPEETYPNTIDFVANLHRQFKLEPIVSAYPDVHPLAASPQQDMDHLKAKVEAGAKRAITQFFFDAETFLRFRDKVHENGVVVNLTPGILPIHNVAQVLKFATGCGAKVPAGFQDRFTRHGDDQDRLRQEGIDHTVELCEELRNEGVTDFHFYTLNRNLIMNEICSRLRFNRAQQQSA